MGPRSKHSIVYDLIQKLKANRNGTQNKSYLHVVDSVKAMLLGLEKATDHVEIYNTDSEDQINVKTIAQLVIDEMSLINVELKLTGDVDGGRGWKSDVKMVLLDIGKIKSLGRKPKISSQQSLEQTAKAFYLRK